MQIILFFLGIVVLASLMVVFVIDPLFDFVIQLINLDQIFPAIAIILGIIVVIQLIKKISPSGTGIKFYFSCYTNLLKNPYFYLVEIMAIIAVWDKAWILALTYGLAFPFIVANVIFLGNKFKLLK